MGRIETSSLCLIPTSIHEAPINAAWLSTAETKRRDRPDRLSTNQAGITNKVSRYSIQTGTRILSRVDRIPSRGETNLESN
jgi:hypothetical protein